jgi:formimidoylglutamate deiminase
VPPSWLPLFAEYAKRADMPLHMHVAEQPREIDECLAETGKRPMELCEQRGMLGPRFVAVHATHLLPHEARLLGDAQGFACICPTTERDLGDGLADFEHLRSSGVRLCTGIDSHTITDPIEELRSLETHERLRRKSRVTFAPDGRTPAEQLWKEGSLNGALAVGFTDAGGEITIDLEHPQLALVEPGFELDAIVFGASSAVVLAT